jgi:hypothetical protein
MSCEYYACGGEGSHLFRVPLESIKVTAKFSCRILRLDYSKGSAL